MNLEIRSWNQSLRCINENFHNTIQLYDVLGNHETVLIENSGLK